MRSPVPKIQGEKAEDCVLREIGIAVDASGDIFFDSLQAHPEQIDRFQYMGYHLYPPRNMKKSLLVNDEVLSNVLGEDSRQYLNLQMERLAKEMSIKRWNRGCILSKNPFLPLNTQLWYGVITRWQYFLDETIANSPLDPVYTKYRLYSLYFLRYIALEFIKLLLVLSILPILIIIDICCGRYSATAFCTGEGLRRNISSAEQQWIYRFISTHHNVYDQAQFEHFIKEFMEALIPDVQESITSHIRFLVSKNENAPFYIKYYEEPLIKLRYIKKITYLSRFYPSLSSVLRVNENEWNEDSDGLLIREYQVYLLQFQHTLSSEEDFQHLLATIGIEKVSSSSEAVAAVSSTDLLQPPSHEEQKIERLGAKSDYDSGCDESILEDCSSGLSQLQMMRISPVRLKHPITTNPLSVLTHSPTNKSPGQNYTFASPNLSSLPYRQLSNNFEKKLILADLSNEELHSIRGIQQNEVQSDQTRCQSKSHSNNGKDENHL